MKIQGDALHFLNAVIQTPALLTDCRGRIININRKAELLFSENFHPSDVSELLTDEAQEKFALIIQQVLESGAAVSEKMRLISFSDSDHEEYELSFMPVCTDKNDSALLCSFVKSEADDKKNHRIKLTVSAEEIRSLVSNRNILEVIDHIKTSYPFTFLTKTKLQNEINRLNELFWLKDTQGKYILVNSKYSQLLGLKPVQLEGKNENEFLPRYLNDFYSSIKKFIVDTSNAVIRQGIVLPALAGSASEFETIEFPLCDLDNNVIAILGIAQPVTGNKRHITAKDESIKSSLFGQISYPFVLLDSRGLVKFVSHGFIDVTGVNVSNGMTFRQFLPEALADETEEFIISNGQDSTSMHFHMHLGAESKQRNKREQSFVFNIRKIYNSADEIEGYLLTFDKAAVEESTNFKLNREKMYEILMQTSPEPIFIYDVENLRFLEVNQAALVLYGYSYNDFLQMDLTDLYAPEDIQTLLDASAQAGKDGSFTGPWRHKKRDGNTVLVEISKSVFEYKGKKAHFNIIRDVTEKVELHKQLQLYKAAFENMSDMLFVTDAEGFITEVNNAVHETLNYSKTDLVNRPFATLASDQERALINSGIFYSTLKKPVDIDAHLKKADGTLLEVKLIASPVIDFSGQVIAYDIVVKSDEQPEIRYIQTENVINHSESMEAETKPQSPAAAVDTTFLSSVFHEILTPMNVILGFIQEITESAEGDEGDLKEAVEIIDQNRQLLLQTMDAAIEYSHFEQNKYDLNVKTLVFTDLLDSIEKNTRKIIAQNKITFSYGKISSSLTLETDPHRLETLISSLITLAVHQTKEKQLYLSAYQYDDKSCIVTLKDKRGSITPGLASTMEEVFSTDDKNLIKNSGLSPISFKLTRKILQLLSGRFETVRRAGEIAECGFVFPLVLNDAENDAAEVFPSFETEQETEFIAESNVNDFADDKPVSPEFNFDSADEKYNPVEKDPFSVDIPVIDEIERAVNIKEPLKFFDEPVMKTIEEPKPSVNPLSKVDLSRLKCLYVEDQIDSQILFKVQMKDLKSIDFAVSFESALPLLEPGKFDFIVMDINLQGEYNGLDALRIIRRLPGYENSFIIAVTAYVLPGDKEKFIAAGFNGFISKPILREKLIESLDGYFARYL